jgi:hypothetical protein
LRRAAYDQQKVDTGPNALRRRPNDGSPPSPKTQDDRKAGTKQEGERAPLAGWISLKKAAAADNE